MPLAVGGAPRFGEKPAEFELNVLDPAADLGPLAGQFMTDAGLVCVVGDDVVGHPRNLLKL